MRNGGVKKLPSTGSKTAGAVPIPLVAPSHTAEILNTDRKEIENAIQSKAHVLVGISVGQVYHENGQLSALLHSLKTDLNVKIYYLIIGDLLQRYSEAIFTIFDENNIKVEISDSAAKREGTRWLSRNELSLKVKHLKSVPIRWEFLISDEYGLDLMLDEMQAEKGKFYVRMSDNLDLEYTVINPKGEKVINKITKEELRNDLFLIEEEFTQLSQDFDPKKLKKYLPEILNITSERGHTPSNANANYPTLKGKYYSTLLEAYAKEYITYYESKPSPFKTAVDKSVGIYLEEKINKWKKDHKITKLANNPVLTKAQELSRQYILEEIAVFMSLLLELWLQTDETTHYLAYPGQTLPALTEACKQLKNICQNTEGLKSLNLNKDLELQVISFKIEKTKGNQRTFVPTVNNISFFQNLNTSHPSSYPPASAPPTASHLERTHSHTYFPKLSPQNGERRKKIEQQEVERLKQLLFMFSKETGNCIETLEKQIQNGSSIEDSPQAFSKEHIGQDESTEYSPKYRGK